MTPEVIVHHPIPEDLCALLKSLGYAPVLETASYTRLKRTTRTADEPGRDPRRAAERKAHANQVLYTPEQTAQLLGVGRTTIYKLINAGKLRSVTIGRCRRIGATDLQRFVEALGQPDSRRVG